MDRRKVLQLFSLAAVATPAISRSAFAASEPVVLTVGYEKVAHLAPIVLIADQLKTQGVELKLVEFVRYADARTALLSGSLDIAAVGPADLGIALANGATGVVGLMGVGSSPKYPVVRKGVKIDSWDDIKGKKIAIAPGSAVWFQFAASLVEHKIPYDSFKAVNIQGGGSNFDEARKRGDVDAIITWEPFESTPVLEGYAEFAKNVDYSTSKSVGAELGMLMAAKAAITNKSDAVQKFVTAYVTKMKELSTSPKDFGAAIARLTGLTPAISDRIAAVIKLGPVVTAEQIQRQTKAFHDLGVIPKDVSAEIPQYWNTSYLTKAMGA
jgi:sulfonate transport system substrate-binding protein